MIDVENMDRRATDGRSSDQLRSLPTKVVSSPIISRVEQSSGSAARRISARDVRSFVKIAVVTRQGGIRERGFATMLLGDDVVDLIGSEIELARHSTILADAVRSQPHATLERRFHAVPEFRRGGLRTCRAFA